MRELRTGGLAYWLDDQRRPVRCKVELVTNERVYLRATTDDAGRRKDEVWYEARFTRRVAPREAVYVRNGKGYFDYDTVMIVPD